VALRIFPILGSVRFAEFVSPAGAACRIRISPKLGSLCFVVFVFPRSRSGRAAVNVDLTLL
jgi:hypothetical protein